jgi:putative phage-type endonuclease
MPVTRYQGTDAWLEERRSGYGASDAPVLVDGDEQAWRQLHAVKLGLTPDRPGTETMELGKRLEDTIAAIAAERIGEPLIRVNRLIRHPDHPEVFASLDRRRKRGGRPVEIKKYGFKTDAFGPAGSDLIPDRMVYQVQQQIAVTGADAADVGVLFAGSKFELFAVGRDQGLIDQLIRIEVAAWAYVARGEMPPWPGPAVRAPVLAQDEIVADEDLNRLAELYLEQSAALVVQETQLDATKQAIRERLVDVGGAVGRAYDGRQLRISYRPQAPAQKVGWESVAAGYRRRLLELGVPEADLDFAQHALTITAPAIRPLRITTPKEKRHAA